MKNLLKFSMVLGLSACTSTVTSVTKEQDAGNAGSAGSTVTEEGGAGQSSGGSSGEGGSSGSGMAGMPSGGSGGQPQMDGGAGMPSAGTGGSSGMAGSGGDGGSGGGPCVPKNCLTIAVELSGGDTEAEACGVVEDGCGNLVDCNGCNNPNYNNNYVICSESFKNSDAKENLCGIVCGHDSLSEELCPSTTNPILCNRDDGPPYSGCTENNFIGSDIGTSRWCCPFR